MYTYVVKKYDPLLFSKRLPIKARVRPININEVRSRKGTLPGVNFLLLEEAQTKVSTTDDCQPHHR